MYQGGDTVFISIPSQIYLRSSVIRPEEVCELARAYEQPPTWKGGGGGWGVGGFLRQMVECFFRTQSKICARHIDKLTPHIHLKNMTDRTDFIVRKQSWKGNGNSYWMHNAQSFQLLLKPVQKREIFRNPAAKDA